jgi:NTP pyrophosphatase (non-canonical NTP hydrolase)
MEDQTKKTDLTFEQLHMAFVKWEQRTFPDETPEELYKHLREECEELIAAPTDPHEYADVILTVLALAEKHGIEVVSALRDKFAINIARDWARGPGGYRHTNARPPVSGDTRTLTWALIQ